METHPYTPNTIDLKHYSYWYNSLKTLFIATSSLKIIHYSYYYYYYLSYIYYSLFVLPLVSSNESKLMEVNVIYMLHIEWNTIMQQDNVPNAKAPPTSFYRKGSHDRIRVGTCNTQPLDHPKKTLLNLTRKHSLPHTTSKKNCPLHFSRSPCPQNPY
jgi:hypothetical protein